MNACPDTNPYFWPGLLMYTDPLCHRLLPDRGCCPLGRYSRSPVRCTPLSQSSAVGCATWTRLLRLCFCRVGANTRLGREEIVVQVAHHARGIALLHYEAAIDFRRALGNHADVNGSIRNGIEYACCDAGLAVNVFTDEANNCLLVFARDICNFFQVFK